MEKFIKKSQRNKLWAHARNKTTEKQLSGKLQHLEEEYEKDFRQYIRKKNRIERELTEMRRLYDDHNYMGHSSGKELLSSRESIRSQPVSSPYYSVGVPLYEPNILMTLSDTTEVSNITSSHGNNAKFKTLIQTDRSTIHLKLPQTPCKYNIGLLEGSACQHFPCHIPRSYHTLGNRREDLTVVDKMISKASHHQATSGHRVSPTPQSKQNDLRYRLTAFGNEMTTLPCILGPVFTPKPFDPILEQIRSGSLEQTREMPSMTRKTVQAKIRGLRQLAFEMRCRNDLTKPLDWAVNYGARVPTRVLLNPVFPVSI